MAGQGLGPRPCHTPGDCTEYREAGGPACSPLPSSLAGPGAEGHLSSGWDAGAGVRKGWGVGRGQKAGTQPQGGQREGEPRTPGEAGRGMRAGGQGDGAEPGFAFTRRRIHERAKIEKREAVSGAKSCPRVSPRPSITVSYGRAVQSG